MLARGPRAAADRVGMSGRAAHASAPGVSAGDAGRASASLLPIPDIMREGDDGTPAPPSYAFLVYRLGFAPSSSF